MLDDIKYKQPLFYNVLSSSLKNTMLSHAYLIDINNNENAFCYVLSFVKAIICNNHYTNGNKCDGCDICNRIMDNNYPEFKIIKPDGLWIKKDDICALQRDFSKKAIEGVKRVYVVLDCEKMRKETANSMLKFLEEPEDNVIAILVTNNMANVLDTIISRCQLIKLEHENVLIDSLSLVEQTVWNFVFSLENSFSDSLVNTKNLWHDIIKDRDSNIIALDIMIDIYRDILNVKLCNKCVKYVCLLDKYQVVCNNNTLDKLLDKLDIVLNIKDSVKYNVNINLLIDRLIIELGGQYESSRC